MSEIQRKDVVCRDFTLSAVATFNPCRLSVFTLAEPLNGFSEILKSQILRKYKKKAKGILNNST